MAITAHVQHVIIVFKRNRLPFARFINNSLDRVPDSVVQELWAVLDAARPARVVPSPSKKEVAVVEEEEEAPSSTSAWRAKVREAVKVAGGRLKVKKVAKAVGAGEGEQEAVASAVAKLVKRGKLVEEGKYVCLEAGGGAE